MLCLGLRPKLPAIVEGGHRRREVEETSSYKWFWGPVELSKPFEVSCPQAVKICSTHGGRRLTACSGQTDTKQQVERTYFSFDCSLCCHTLLKLAFLIQFTKSVEHQPQPVLIKCPCPKVFQCGQSMTLCCGSHRSRR